MSKGFLKGIVGVMLLSLIACGPGQRKSEMKSGENKNLFALEWISEEKAIDGGTLKVAVVNSSPFKGIFLPVLNNDHVDSLFLQNLYEEIFRSNGDFNITDEGIAKLTIDEENNVLKVKIKENLKWSDGEPLTVDDYVFSYEIIGHPDYTGVRYDSNIELVKGMKEYHAGKTSKISGLVQVSDTELHIHLTQLTPGVLVGNGGLIPSLSPRHYLKDVAIKDLETSDKVRIKPLSYGKYMVKQIIQGESVEFVPNPYYHDKDAMPKVEKMIMKIVPDSVIVASMKNGEYDTYANMNQDIYSEYKDFDNLAITGNQDLYFQYLGFNLGHFDEQKGENVTDTNAKMYDINLRKAMAYAVDIETIAEAFYNGLRERANSPIPPIMGKYHTNETRFTYNPEKARELLDKAGYKDIDGDGIREDKNGKPFEIKFAFPTMGDIAEPMAQKYIQDWKEVGLKVTLTSGRPMEGNSFFDKVQANDKEIDMWIAAWSVGTSLDMSVYSRESIFNFTRLTSEKNDELLAKIEDIRGLKDPQFKIDAVKEWEKNYMENELGYIPVTFKYSLNPVNKRVKHSSSISDNTVTNKIVDALTATEPYKSTK